MGSSHRAVLLCSVVATLTLAAPAADPDTGLPSLVVLSLQPAAGVDPEATTRQVVAGVLLLPGDNDVVPSSAVPTPSGAAFAGVFP